MKNKLLPATSLLIKPQELVVSFKSPTPKTKVSISNQRGLEFYSETYHTSHVLNIPTSSFPKGVYKLQIENMNESSNTVFTKF